jgi:hypothetical protein
VTPIIHDKKNKKKAKKKQKTKSSPVCLLENNFFKKMNFGKVFSDVW